jgi:hypothetical protein
MSKIRSAEEFGVGLEALRKYTTAKELLERIYRRRKVPCKVINENWTVNLKKTERHMDLTEEIDDLMASYNRSIENLKDQETRNLRVLVDVMKDFIEVYEEKRYIESKLENLREKIGSAEEQYSDER